MSLSRDQKSGFVINTRCKYSTWQAKKQNQLVRTERTYSNRGVGGSESGVIVAALLMRWSKSKI